MDIDDVITLDDNSEYVVLDTAEMNGDKYLFCVGIDENDEPTEEYVYYKEVHEGDDTYVEEIEDEETMQNIVNLFTTNFINDNMVDTGDEQAI